MSNDTVPAEAASAGLQPTRANGWSAGFSNVFNKEVGDWFGTLRWLIQAILWIVILGGFVGFVVFIVPVLNQIATDAAKQQGQTIAPISFNPLLEGISTFFSLAGLFGCIGVIILSQDELIGEKQLGTAAWILSKPVSRHAFILGKLAANIVCILLFVLALPAIVSYVEIWIAAGKAPDVLPFLAGLLFPALVLLFYLCLSTLLGTLFSQRAPLLAVLFGVLFGGSIVASFVPEVSRFLPVDVANMGTTVALGQSLPDEAMWPLLATGGWCVVFIAAALALFSRQEV